MTIRQSYDVAELLVVNGFTALCEVRWNEKRPSQEVEVVGLVDDLYPGRVGKLFEVGNDFCQGKGIDVIEHFQDQGRGRIVIR